jgi:serine/threonine-protein kinase RsbW
MVTGVPISRKIVVESTSAAVDRLCKSILSELQDCQFDQQDIFAIHLALEEAFINAVKHGNQMNPDKKITAEYQISDDRMEITVVDEGAGFNPSVVPDPREGENLYKTDGRGLFLMKAYMDVVEYNQKGSSVRMVKYKQGHKPAKNS